MEDETIPPRKPRTIRTALQSAWEWLKAHPDWALMFVLGFIAGAVLF